MAIIQVEWQRMLESQELSRHVDEVQRILDRHQTERIALIKNPEKSERIYPIRHRGQDFLALKDLLQFSFSLQASLTVGL